MYALSQLAPNVIDLLALPVEELAGQLERISGLTLEQLQRNYQSVLVCHPLDDAHQVDGLGEKLRIMGIGDPHQEQIITSIDALGRPKSVTLTGR